MELDELGIGANDLVQIWRSEIFKELSDFQTSLEHISFYVRSKSGEGIEKPKAWMMKQLNRGYYAAPVGFKSREQQFEEAKLADIQSRVQEIQQIKRKQFEAGCEIWLMGLDEDLRRKLLPSGVKAESPAGKAVLREAYAKEVGFNL